MKEKVKLTDWDIQDYLKTPDERAYYIEAAIDETREYGDMRFLAEALADVAKAIGSEQVAAFMKGVSAGIAAAGTSAPRTARRKTRNREAAMA